MFEYLKRKYAEAQRQEMHTDYEAVGDYPSYEEANERQHELLSCEIPAFVVRESTGFLEVYIGQLPRFYLYVSKDIAPEARKIVDHTASEDHKHIASCPACGSSDVVEIGVVKNYHRDHWIHLLEAFLVVSHRAIAEFMLGPKYHCEKCSSSYRANFRKEVSSDDSAISD